jgi:GNAT acetyltransferase-like protein
MAVVKSAIDLGLSDHPFTQDVIIESASPPVRIRPLAEVLSAWDELRSGAPARTLFHSPAWCQALKRAYGFRISVATLEKAGRILAGCLLSRTRNPFVRRVVSLPFSDACPPLGQDDAAVAELIREMAKDRRIGGHLELRGVRAPAPWTAVDCFEQWSLDLARGFAEIQRRADRNLRRQAKHAAAAALKIESGSSPAMLSRFYRIQLQTRRRLGVPPQPMRFFTAVHKVFAKFQGIEVWLATSNGRDHAGVVLLRDEDRLYAKWSARAADSLPGSAHLLFLSILEHHAEKAAVLDLGRTDSRNTGLSRFKAEMGASSAPLPYSYLPHPPHIVSAEAPGRGDRAIARVWRRLPIPVTRAVGAIAYRYLA